MTNGAGPRERSEREQRYMDVLLAMDAPTCDWYPPKRVSPSTVKLRGAALRAEAIRSKTVKGKGLTRAQRAQLVAEDEAARRRETETRGIMRSTPGASAAHRGVKSTHALADRARREVDDARERLTDGKAHPVTTRRVGSPHG